MYTIMQAVIYAMIKKDYTTERSREGTAALDDGKRSAAMREVVMNKKTNLLQLEEHFYQLVDVEEPNVFHNLFPYSEIPKIAFNDRIVPHNMPENIWITDTTFRDGQQSRAPYTTEQIVTIYDYLHKLGGPKDWSVRVNFSYIARRTGMRSTSAWKEDTSSRRLRAGSVQASRISSW